jgi:hypothetical protein
LFLVLTTAGLACKFGLKGDDQALLLFELTTLLLFYLTTKGCKAVMTVVGRSIPISVKGRDEIS